MILCHFYPIFYDSFMLFLTNFMPILCEFYELEDV